MIYFVEETLHGILRGRYFTCNFGKYSKSTSKIVRESSLTKVVELITSYRNTTKYSTRPSSVREIMS